MQENRVVIGTTVSKESSYAFDEFLMNQKIIREHYPNSELVIATSDANINTDEIKCKLINYPKPELPLTDDLFIPQKLRILDMVAGRNAVSDYFLKTGTDFFLSVDADMTYDSYIVTLLLNKIEGYDVVMSGYMTKNERAGYSLGCALIRRKVLEKIHFNCMIFPSSYDMPNIIEDGWMFEHDAFREGFKIKRGKFIRIDHIVDENHKLITLINKLTPIMRIKSNSIIRYLLVRSCIHAKRDIPRLILKKIEKT